MDANDVELRMVDPQRNRFRVYGMTVCRTLFGELALRIAWGRIGNRRLREKTEVFTSEDALERRRAELLALRSRHGYRVLERRREVRSLVVSPVTPSPAIAVAAALCEAHGLPLADRGVRGLVARWHAATLDLVRMLGERGAETLDLVDVSTLAAMYVEAAAVA